MRTIKFRGKCAKDSRFAGEWVYGSCVQCEKSDDVLITSAINDRCSCTYHVDPATVGQFTGLTDKNGKEIYEGDIVSHPWKDPIFGDLVETGQFVHSTICFNNGAFVVNYRLQGEYIYLQDFLRLKCLEVIGNIHDNPELLEEGGDK